MNAEDIKKHRQELERRIAALDGMTQTEGWKLFQAMMEASERAIYARMQTDPAAETARHFGAYNAIKDLRGWVERERLVMVHQLQQWGKDSK